MRFILLATLLTPPLLSASACSDDQSPQPGDPDAAIEETPDASPPEVAFVRFRRAFAGGPCPAETDCSGFIDLRADGLLRFDRMGELPVVVHQATVTAAERDQAIEVLTDPALVALLDLGDPPCEPPTDIFDSMTLIDDGDRHTNSVTFCSDDPIVAARQVLDDLAAAYFP